MTYSLLVAYHGCDLNTKNSLLDGSLKSLNPSNNPYDWLGSGVYFFVEDYQRAMQFAISSKENPEKKYTAKPILTASVVGAIINLGNCWDLGTQKGLHYFKTIHTRMLSEKIPLRKNKKNNSEDADFSLRTLDRAVINTGHTIFEQNGMGFDTVISIFEQGKSVVEGSSFRGGTHSQIAVRNNDCIIAYFCPIEKKLHHLNSQVSLKQ